MDYLDLIIEAVEYIEANLKQPITPEDVASHVGFSMYHFHRIFQFAVKDTMAGYIRERRMTHAANDLLTSSKNILGIALDYQFESHESFTRAFQRMFGVSPSVFRRNPNSMKTLLRVSRRQRLDAAAIRHMMDHVTPQPVFVEKAAFSVVGVAQHSSEGDFSSAWKSFVQGLSDVPNVVDSNIHLGLIARTNVNVEFDYIACTEVAMSSPPPQGMIYREFPGNEYAVFTHYGSEHNLDLTWTYALGIWLPKSGYRRATGPEFECYDDRRYRQLEKDSQIDIYVPIQKE